jgi:hypothetical protein
LGAAGQWLDTDDLEPLAVLLELMRLQERVEQIENHSRADDQQYNVIDAHDLLLSHVTNSQEVG